SMNDMDKAEAIKKTTTKARGFFKDTGATGISANATFDQQVTMDKLAKKFTEFSSSTSALGKSRAVNQKDTAIKAVYSSWLDGDITEAQPGEIFSSQKIDPQQAEYTYVRSIDDDEV